MVKAEDLSHTIAFVTLEQINDWLEQFGLQVTIIVPHNEHGHAKRGTAFFLTTCENAPLCDCEECVSARADDPLANEINELLEKD